MIQTIKTVKSKCDTDPSWTANFVWFNDLKNNEKTKQNETNPTNK